MTEEQQSKLIRQRMKCKKKFLRFFPNGFEDPKYLERERNPKWEAHEMFQRLLGKREFERLLAAEDFKTIGKNAVAIETKTNLLYPAEKSALRNALRSVKNTQLFATGLFTYMYAKLNVRERFEHFSATLAGMPKKSKGLLTWPMQTVFAFLGNPEHFIFMKPLVTKAAAKAYGFDFFYEARPNWNTYQSIYSFANQVKQDNEELKPRDFIDLQSFIRVIGSAEYK
jgi:hypothetical protein